MTSVTKAKICALAVLQVALPSLQRLEAQFLAPPRADSSVRYLIARLARGDTSGIVLPVEPSNLAAQGISRDSLLHILLSGFSIGPVTKAEVIDRTDFHPFNATRVDEQLTYHVVGGLTAIRWQPAPADLRQMNPFRLSGKSWLHYAILALAVLIPLFSLTTAVAAAVSHARLKWLWAVASLVSIGKLSIVWTDSLAGNAVVRFQPINLQLLGAGIFKYPLYAPWIISVGLPVFAVGYWLVARRRASVSNEAPQVAA